MQVLLKGKVVGIGRLWVMLLVVRFLREKCLRYRHPLEMQRRSRCYECFLLSKREP